MNHLLRLRAGEFLGQTLRSYAVSGLRLTETFYPVGMRQPEHAHEASLFCFVLAGTYVETMGRQTRVRRPLALAFHPSGSPHAENYVAPGRHLLVEMDNRWLNSAREYDVLLDRPVEFEGGASTWLVTRLYREFQRPDDVSPLAVEGVMLELLAETSRRAVRQTESRPPYWLKQVTNLLHDRFNENLSLCEIASAVDVHATHLARVFRKFHGCTVGDYLRRLRVQQASDRLSTSDESLADIASAAGFADQSHLSRVFKQQTGMRPNRFRRLIRKC